jgi:hypothetical protein
MEEFDAEFLVAQLEPLLPNSPMKETEANPNKP